LSAVSLSPSRWGVCVVESRVAVGGAVSVVDLFGGAVAVVVDSVESVCCVVVESDERFRQPVVRATAAVGRNCRRENCLTLDYLTLRPQLP